MAALVLKQVFPYAVLAFFAVFGAGSFYMHFLFPVREKRAPLFEDGDISLEEAVFILSLEKCRQDLQCILTLVAEHKGDLSEAEAKAVLRKLEPLVVPGGINEEQAAVVIERIPPDSDAAVDALFLVAAVV